MEAIEHHQAQLEAERMIVIYGNEKAINVVNKRINQTESNYTAMYYGKVLNNLQKLKTE